jgi:hypothetical protein
MRPSARLGSSARVNCGVCMLPARLRTHRQLGRDGRAAFRLDASANALAAEFSRCMGQLFHTDGLTHAEKQSQVALVASLIRAAAIDSDSAVRSSVPVAPAVVICGAHCVVVAAVSTVPCRALTPGVGVRRCGSTSAATFRSGRSRCRCGRGEPSPGADVGGAARSRHRCGWDGAAPRSADAPPRAAPPDVAALGVRLPQRALSAAITRPVGTAARIDGAAPLRRGVVRTVPPRAAG